VQKLAYLIHSKPVTEGSKITDSAICWNDICTWLHTWWSSPW